MGKYAGYILDLDGTVYRGEKVIAGAPEAIASLRAAGARVLFLSNNPTRSQSSYAEKLTRMQIPTGPDEVLNSAVVMARHLARTAPGARVYLIGEGPVADELKRYGIQVVTDPQRVDYVIVSGDRQFTYAKLNLALQAVRGGARLLATHADLVYPVENGGVVPDAGALIAAVEAVTEKQIELVAGKPSPLAAQEALRALGLRPDECLVVGDRLDTDIRMGSESGIDTALVLTGITRQEEIPSSPWKPTHVLGSVADLIRLEAHR